MKLLKSIIRKARFDSYHNLHKKQAQEVLQSIEQEKGKTPSTLIKAANEYANDILGWKGYAPWLEVYTAVQGDFKEGWIPDNYYGEIVVPATRGYYGPISRLAPLSNRLFESDAFPNLVYRANGIFLTTQYDVIQPDELKDYLFKQHQKVVFKVNQSNKGEGIYFLKPSTFDLKKIMGLGDGVFQSCIEQHSFFDQFNADAVATLRITSVFGLSGEVTVNAAFLRLAPPKETHVKSNSHIRISVNPETGKLDGKGYLANWRTTDHYAGSNLYFENITIPQFDVYTSEVKKLHKSMPFVRCVGWDVIMDKGNMIKIMEWNGVHNDIKFSEATQGPCFRGMGWENLKKLKK